MSNEQKILDRILADAKAEADAIIAKAQAEADEVVAAAQAKADKELDALAVIADGEAEKAAAKAVSGAQMDAKMQILAAKQGLLETAVSKAREQLLQLSDKDEEYKNTMLGMIKGAGIGAGEILLSAKDKVRIGEALKAEGVPVGEETRDIVGGFIVKDGEIEYNYSFSSILTIQREEIETAAAAILFG